MLEIVSGMMDICCSPVTISFDGTINRWCSGVSRCVAKQQARLLGFCGQEFDEINGLLMGHRWVVLRRAGTEDVSHRWRRNQGGCDQEVDQVNGYLIGHR